MGACASAPKDHRSAVRATMVDALPRDDGELFFDSRPWWDSDCEDYFSVYDETTPRTSIHHSIRIERTPDFFSETPSTEPKKLLIELFRESNDFDPVVVDQTLFYTSTAPGPVDSPTITHDKASNSVWCSEMTPNSKPLKVRSSPCCLPNLVQNLSFNERRKRLRNGNYSPSTAAPSTTGN